MNDFNMTAAPYSKPSLMIFIAVFGTLSAIAQSTKPLTQIIPQSSPATEVEEDFDSAAATHKVELRDLMISRGVSPIEELRSSRLPHEWVPSVIRDYYPSEL
jgi:hypothetical protein